MIRTRRGVPWQDFLKAHQTFPAIVEQKASSDPNALFVHCRSEGSASWGRLHADTLAWSDRLAALGVRKGDVVATILDAGLTAMSLWLGMARIGAIDATVNSQFRGSMLVHALTTCRPRVVVVESRYFPNLAQVAGDLATVEKVLVLGDGIASRERLRGIREVIHFAEVHERPGLAEALAQSPQWHDIACVSFTSGTTGPSKAVMLPWGQLLCNNLGTFPFEDLTAEEVFYCVTSHAHFGAKAIPYMAAMAGGQVVVRPRFSLSSFWDDVHRFNVTSAMLVGTMAQMLMRQTEAPRSTTLRNVFMTPLSNSYDDFVRRFGVRVKTVYSSTELSIPICSEWNPANQQTSGRLRNGFPGFEVRLVDANDQEVAEGQPGECIVRSAVPWSMNAGYLNNPEATASAWRNGWFHTGDVLMRNTEGDYVFVDRLKDVIRRRGENISSAEVEADVVANPDVAECAAVAVAAEEGDDEILLFVVAVPGSNLTEQALCAELAERMTPFMVPRFVEFLPAMPKTDATQRIVKADLRGRGLGPQTWDRLSATFHEASFSSIAPFDRNP